MSNVPDYDHVRAQIAAGYKNISAVMVQTLRESAISQIDVRFQGAHINATSFAKVRHIVESGQVLVVHIPSFTPETAKTIYPYDIILAAFGTANNLWRKSALVHEAVHVRTDMRGKTTSSMQDEVLAYIVQAVYLRLGGLQSNNYPGATDQRLVPAALAIADTLLTRNHVTLQQESTLKAAIKAKPEYTGIVSQILHHDAVRPLRH